MKTKTDFTILERAIATVEGFEGVYKTLQQNITLRGQSPSTLHNYTRQISLVSLHFNCLPEKLTDDQLNGYLAGLAISANSPSRSAFKHAVFGLRYYFKVIGDVKRAIKLPSIKKEAALPVILNRSELRALFAAPKLLKHRVLLTLIYSAGLRSKEVINLKIADIDFERKTIHIRRSKYNKDRIVPLSDNMAIGLHKYLKENQPQVWLFNGHAPGSHYAAKSIAWVMREALKKTGISKEVTIHSLRHSYATHLIEDGLNIVTVKELLGHACIETTMIYLHVAQCPLIQAHSPMDTLYPRK